MAAEARAPLAPRPAFARVAAPRPRSSASVPALRLFALYQAGNWPRRGHRRQRRRRSRAPAEREGEGVAASCPARRPAASRLRRAPPWGRLQCPFGASAAPNGGVRLRPRRRHSRRGPWCARSLAVRPARHRCSRACGLATTAVRCDCMQSHLPAVTCLLPAPLHLAATCSLQFSARARLSRASPRLRRGRRLRRRPLTACARPLPTVAGGARHA